MNKYLLLVCIGIISFIGCKREETQVTTTDSTNVVVEQPTDSAKPSASPVQESSPTEQSNNSENIERGQQIMPVDEAHQDASFLEFRGRLISSIQAKEGEAIVKVLDSGIKLSFGGSGGIADFKKMWRPNDESSPLWQKLGWVMSHGGSFRGTGANRTFWAPYVYSTWPDSGPDAFEYGAIVGDRVSVFEKADSTSPVVSTLDHHFVKVLDGNHLKEKQPTFVKIQTPLGKIGYVRSSQIRSQLDYRAGFSKRNGEWKMSIFIAGD